MLGIITFALAMNCLVYMALIREGMRDTDRAARPAVLALAALFILTEAAFVLSMLMLCRG